MRKLLVASIIAALLLGITGALAEGNLLVNGGFENAQDGWPLYWEEDMWLYDVGVSYLELREGGRDGTGLCAMVENVSANDARFVQTVQVEPETIYKLTGWIKAEGCDTAYGGAALSIIGAYVSFPGLYDTAGEWVHTENYFRTDAGQTEIVIGARLGDYSADNVGKAYFDDLSLVAVEEVPSGFFIQQINDYSKHVNIETPAAKETSPVSPSPLLWSALFLFFLLPALWYLRVRGVPYPQLAIWLVMGLALVVRAYLMATQPGYTTDMNCFFTWGLRMAEMGPSGFYTTEMFCDYPPGYMYLLWATGGLLRLFNVPGLDSAVTRLIVKLMPMLADLGAVYLIFSLGRKRISDEKAVLLALLYALSPAVLVNGAIWGQVDAVMALGLLAAVVLASERKWHWALPVYTVTVLLKPQALMVGPVGLAALAANIAATKDRKKLVMDALKGLGLAVAAAVALLLPFLWGKPEPVKWVFDLYAKTLASYAHPTVNAANLYYLLGANWGDLNATVLGIPYGTLGTVMMVLVVVGVMWQCWKRRDEDMLPFFGALMFIAMFVLGVKMHERYLFPALLLLLYAYIRRQDWRYLLLFAGYSVTLYINCAIVLRDLHLPQGFGFAGCALAVLNLALLGLAIWTACDPKRRPLSDKQIAPREPEDKTEALTGKTPPAFAMRARDWALMLGLTAVYAVIAYVGLGATEAPQTTWVSTGANEEVVLDLGEESTFHMLYYGNITSRDFMVEFSDDGEVWSEPFKAEMGTGECFRWKYLTPEQFDGSGGRTRVPNECQGRYVRLTPNGPSLALMELGFRDTQGALLPVVSITGTGAREGNAYDPALLVDEQSTVPVQPSYFNSSYFDEIYHARTGYEHAHALETYETTHPALGKVIIMWGIQLFGMTPFGWRFMGALMGVLMVPAMFLLAKLLFKKTRYAFLGAFVMAFDMMHLTQTRIATIDSYAVLFIILMFLCMFRYLQMSFFRDGWRTLIPLSLSGLFMGLGCASKWICIYAGAGLAVLFFWSLWQRYKEYSFAMAQGGELAASVAKFRRYALGTVGFCFAFFIVIPFAIYYFSYIPHYAFNGGLTWSRFWNGQVSMYNYHANLVDDHSFQSPWYEWPLILKPMYYYNGSPYVQPGMVSSIMCMGNPAVWWAGLASLLYVVWQWLKPHFRGETVRDRRPAMLIIAFAAQFLPWVLVPRSTFIYHYFGSLPFVMMAIVFAFEKLYENRPDMARALQIGYMAVVVVLFIGFYPFATGIEFPRWWANMMNWFSFFYLPGWKYRGWLYF